MKSIFTILYLFVVLGSVAQGLKKPEFSFYSIEELKQLQKKINLNSKEKVKSIKGSDYSSEKKHTVKNISKYFENVLEDSVYLHHDYFENKIQEVLSNIYKYNPTLNNPNHIFLLRNEFTPNACSYGISVFEINLGLFTLIETDDELAFIICHELAHQYLSHLEKKVEDRENSFNNDEITKKTNAIKKNKGIKSSKAIKLLKELASDLSEKSRAFEIEADSLGMIYFQNTPYSSQKAQSILYKMGTLEERLFSHKINWKKTYGIDYKGYVNKNTMFKKRVIDADFKISEDSIRTHPGMSLRMGNLGFVLENTANSSASSEPTPQQVLALTSIGSQFKELEKSFYIYSYLHEVFPNEPKHVTALIELIDEVYYCKKHHILGNRVPSFINNYSKEKIYNDVIHFLHEVELQQLKEIQLFLKQKTRL